MAVGRGLGALLRQGALALLLTGATGCVDVSTWYGGFPDPGDAAAAFEIEEITHEYVVVHGKRYTRESFAPIFRHATPEVLAPLRVADATFEKSALLSLGIVGVMTYALPENWPRYVQQMRDAVVAGSYGALLYFDHEATQLYEGVRGVYGASLQRHLARPR